MSWFNTEWSRIRYKIFHFIISAPYSAFHGMGFNIYLFSTRKVVFNIQHLNHIWAKILSTRNVLMKKCHEAILVTIFRDMMTDEVYFLKTILENLPVFIT